MTDYKYVYGPVPSRRMGLSVGISPIPKGYCNYSCIYCQLGRTSHMTNKRENFFKQEDIVEEFKDYISKGTHFDVVTIVGEGEPSLYLDLGILIEKLKELTDKPLAVITNGALLSDAGVRKNLKAADIILPSLDASNEEIFKKINRPHKNINFDSLLQGLETFSQDYKGELWLELMILRDINDSKEFFLDYKKLVEKINYHKLYINSPVRPPAESFVKEPSKEAIEDAITILGGISIDKLISHGFSSESKDDYKAVLSIIKRHPMNQFEIKAFLEQRGNLDSKAFFQKLNHDTGVERVNYKNYNTYRLK